MSASRRASRRVASSVRRRWVRRAAAPPEDPVDSVGSPVDTARCDPRPRPGLLGAAFASVSHALALTPKSRDAFAPLLTAVVLPVPLLSVILLPMSLAPGWLQALSDVNPLEHVVEGTRAFFDGDYGSSTAWWAPA